MKTSADNQNFEHAFAYVGTYGDETHPGGIYTFSVKEGVENIKAISHVAQPAQAGYLVFDKQTHTLYSVDERKNDGRGPVSPPASVFALSVDQASGELTPINSCLAPTPFPTFLNLDSEGRRLVSANHGGFDHIEKAVFKDGRWTSDYLYDDSSVIVYNLGDDGSVEQISDLVVLEGHGKDPNGSLQAGGHAQSGPHAHSCVLSPDRKHLLVCDKGTDRIYVYQFGDKLKLINFYQFPEESAPRHLEFFGDDRVYLTLELSSQVASMNFNPASGELVLIDQVSTLPDNYLYPNEPAEIRVHPKGKFVYLNNRGEDTLVCFKVSSDGMLSRKGYTKLAKSIHPGLAARSFTFTSDGKYIFLADRPDNLLKVYAVDEETGGVSLINSVEVPQPVYVELVSF
ncbi:lactonase family protein [Vibrio albus]|uniref:Lactonase family protein n=1 Tax=Vibrio albus TaxID=2200953 RepID=A0A2U3B9H6_9VIBR|nr:lactonase family protein [Vibrio albus]PWI33438.1 lactonase family protein [Vibrio albus]